MVTHEQRVEALARVLFEQYYRVMEVVHPNSIMHRETAALGYDGQDETQKDCFRNDAEKLLLADPAFGVLAFYGTPGNWERKAGRRSVAEKDGGKQARDAIGMPEDFVARGR